MRQRHQDGGHLGRSGDRDPRRGIGGADHVVETLSGKKSLERERTDWNDQLRCKHLDHRVEPGCAERNLSRAGTSIACSVGATARKARGHSGHVDAITYVVLVAEARANQPAHQLPAGPTREGPGLIVFDRSRCLPDEQDALTRAAAEHRVRTRDVARLRAPRACALLALQRSQRATSDGISRHDHPTLTRRGSVAEPEAISSPHRSSFHTSALSGRRGQPSYFEASCPTSLRALPGPTASDETTAPRRGGRRLTAQTLPT